MNDVVDVSVNGIKALNTYSLENAPLSKLMDLAPQVLKGCRAVRSVGIHPESGKFGVTVFISWDTKDGKTRLWETGPADQADAIYARALCRALMTEEPDLEKLITLLYPEMIPTRS